MFHFKNKDHLYVYINITLTVLCYVFHLFSFKKLLFSLLVTMNFLFFCGSGNQTRGPVHLLCRTTGLHPRPTMYSSLNLYWRSYLMYRQNYFTFCMAKSYLIMLNLPLFPAYSYLNYFPSSVSSNNAAITTLYSIISFLCWYVFRTGFNLVVVLTHLFFLPSYSLFSLTFRLSNTLCTVNRSLQQKCKVE